MKLIEKIVIHRFRSIADTTIEAGDLTIFSGVNNSGKSNVLRALNLFFNGETSFGHDYDFAHDYNQAFTGQAGGKRAIRVTLHFSGQGNAALSKPFNITRIFEKGILAGGYEYHSSDPSVEARLRADDGNTRGQFSRFLGSIQFFYIPAVRDREFVKSLFLNFERLIENDQGSDFDGKISELSQILEQKSLEISKEFQEFIGIPAQAALSSRITDILGAVEVNVDSGIKVRRRRKGETEPESIKINLFSSGDGILMSYLAYFLAHICRKLPSKRFIWGFEEPENSLEYSKVQRLAEEFSNKFERYAQIFITTHSPAFINLKNKNNNMFYRVFITPNDQTRASEIKTLESLNKRQKQLFERGEISSIEYETIKKELGLVDFAVEIERALQSLLQEEKEYIAKKEEFIRRNNAFLGSRPKKILVCEDSDPRAVRVWEKWLRLSGIGSVKVISSKGSSNDFVESGVRYQAELDPDYHPKIFRQIDRDGLSDDQIEVIQDNLLKKHKGYLNYEYRPLPVHELENFAVVSDSNFVNDFWETIKEEVISSFERTAGYTCRTYDKKFDYQQEVFKGSGGGDYISVVQRMRGEALLDWRRLMPGKEICKKMMNYNCMNYLDSLTLNELPPELVDYMRVMKAFFENEE